VKPPSGQKKLFEVVKVAGDFSTIKETRMDSILHHAKIGAASTNDEILLQRGPETNVIIKYIVVPNPKEPNPRGHRFSDNQEPLANAIAAWLRDQKL
jgi:hypothetical protein